MSFIKRWKICEGYQVSIFSDIYGLKTGPQPSEVRRSVKDKHALQTLSPPFVSDIKLFWGECE